MSKKYLVLFIAITLCLSAIPKIASAVDEEGKDQLVKALDAGFVRIIKSGQYWDIIRPVADKLTMVSDLNPFIAQTPFPSAASATGMFLNILDTEKIRVARFLATCSSSSDIWEEVGPQILSAIIGQINANYGKNIQIEYHDYDPATIPSLFKPLSTGEVDMMFTTHSLGGASQAFDFWSPKMMRRYIARFTGTILASEHVVIVRTLDWSKGKYTSFEDVVNDPNAKVCLGPEDSQLGESFLGKVPTGRITKVFCDDINVCSQGLLDGTFDAWMHFDPTIKIPKLKTIETGIVAGTPYWVAQ